MSRWGAKAVSCHRSPKRSCGSSQAVRVGNTPDMEFAPQRPPLALRGIALFEAVKGLLALAAAFGLVSLRHTDLHTAADAFLIRHGIDPEQHYARLFIESLAQATNHHVIGLVSFALVYASVRLLEAYGLWRGKHWAEWVAVVSAGLYLPLEFQHLARHGSWLTTGVICFNFLTVFYMARLLIQQRANRSLRAKV